MVTNVAIDYGAGVSDAWRSIANFVPKLAAFLVILVIGWIIAKVLAKIVTVVLAKVGFDRLTARSGLDGVLAKGNYDAPSLLAKVVYYAILLVALQLAIGVFGPNPISDLLTKLVSWLPKLFIAIVIIVIVAAIARAVKDLVVGALGSASYGRLLGTGASVFIWAAGIIAALNQVGIATTVTTPVLIAVLATVGGVVVVGVGGGLIRPMESRWEGALAKISEEIPARRAERTSANVTAHGRAQYQTPGGEGYGQPVTEQFGHQSPPHSGQHHAEPGYGQPGGQYPPQQPPNQGWSQ
ncbi:hypothetical protein GOEFS_121_00430 [Gordonia effusa NBRC 100432]|uniref:Uncharacterized protein n=1 Tax=Gordonia effusa NBRC 100432 TaxID=1077974 RepID=H0R6E0_9ACTN|nr:hypothetical protein [Gordonia effusa]GAB20641.1 hypothetical protein GOEFS_121_00430 [Gordonia effusa NBRC 100432]